MISLSKYAAQVHGACLLSALVLAVGVATPQVCAGADDRTVQEAREALRVRDRGRLVSARDALVAAHHPLAPWADFWELQNRLVEASAPEVDEFLARWPTAYVADRLRNDWLLVLGHRKDWPTFLRVQSGFRMNDDREVICYGVLARQQTGVLPEGLGDLQEQARQAWWAQKEPDTGCNAMAQTLFPAGVLSTADVWRKLRLAMESDKPKVAQQAAQLLGEPVAQAVMRLMGQPREALFPKGWNGSTHDLTGHPGSTTPVAVISAQNKSKGKTKRKNGKKVVKPSDLPQVAPTVAGLPRDVQGPLNLLAMVRWSSMDPQAAATALGDADLRSHWQWSPEETAWAWALTARHSAWRLQPEATAHYERALAAAGVLNQGNVEASWSQDTLAWMARASLRAAVGGQVQHWPMVERAVNAMPVDQQQDPTWVYWKARALMARSASATQARQQGREGLTRISAGVGFYGLLAAEDLNGAPPKHPPRPARLTEAEQAEALATPGVDRSLRLFALGWRTEAVKEWNYTISHAKPGGLSDRELLAMAEVACDREIWDRCINTSERTRHEIDLHQRFPMPFKHDVLEAAQEVGLDAAYMYGLIRQESRFMVSARSNVGAAGLMQVMPATAEWTARKRGITYAPELITDRQTNLKIGAGYLKLILDDFAGSQAMAAAAYNAGPSRPRRWREGTRIEAAAWAENIPFNETRDYVKKVLANAVMYGHVLHGRPLSIKTRLGGSIGPRASSAPAAQDDLP